MRYSSYYSRLPHLTIECVELDGIPDTLPILIEDIYSPVEEQSTTILSKTKKENSVLQKAQDQQHILDKIRSNLTDNTSEKANETANSSASIPRAKSQQFKINSTPIVRQSGKIFLSFRSHTPTNINPIVALSNEPGIKLTSIRKFDQNNTLESSFGLFPNQSDFHINHRSNSSRLTKKGSSQSLPDVPFKRSHSLSINNVNHIDSPVIPKFLRSKLDKNDNDDEVFVRDNQNQVVTSSTFSDSSTKNVLRESFRYKANTIDRPKILRSFSTSSTHHAHPKYFITKTDNKTITTTIDGLKTYPLNSVLDLTLQLEQVSTVNIDPLLLNGLTDDENQLNLIEKTKKLEEKKLESDRIQTNSSINSQTIE